MSSFPMGSFMGRMLRCPIKKIQKVWIGFFQSAWEPMTTIGKVQENLTVHTLWYCSSNRGLMRRCTGEFRGKLTRMAFSCRHKHPIICSQPSCIADHNGMDHLYCQSRTRFKNDIRTIMILFLQVTCSSPLLNSVPHHKARDTLSESNTPEP
jgi:hypothetical protein